MRTEAAVPLPLRSRPGNGPAVVVVLLVAATAAGLLLDTQLSVTSKTMLYVFAVVFASYRVSLPLALACALGAAALLNYFFLEPRFAFRVDAQENLTALGAMLVVSLVISERGVALRREAEAARRSESRARELQALAMQLAEAGSPEEVQAFGRQALDTWYPGSEVMMRKPPGGHGEAQAGDAWLLPLVSQDQALGTVRVRHGANADAGSRAHAEAICALLAQALWRLTLSAQTRAAEERSQWHRAQNTFLAGISHDFRTPLAAVVTAASSLQTQRAKLTEAEQDRLLHMILEEAGHLSTLTENTLNLARLQHAGELHRDWQSMEEVVGSVLYRVRQRDPARRIHSRVPPALPLIQGDAVLLGQLLENLLDNALKYTGGPVDLVLGVSGDWLLVEVQDRGDGIPAAQVESVFEPYRRADRSGQRGAGLGLAVCRAIARAHRGDLELHGREGGGSVFALRLPVEKIQPAPVPA